MEKILPKVSGTSAPRDGTITVGDYPPIVFKTSDNVTLGGTDYIFVGDFDRNLLELKISASSRSLHGFVLLTAKRTRDTFLTGTPSKVQLGLPVISSSQNINFTGPNGWRRAELRTELCLALGKHAIEISFGKLNSFDGVVKNGNVSFLTFDDYLTAIRIEELTKTDIERLYTCVQP